MTIPVERAPQAEASGPPPADGVRGAEDNEGRATFLADATRLLASSLDYPATLQTLAHLLVPERATACAVIVWDRSGDGSVAVAHADPEKAAVLESFVRPLEGEHGVALLKALHEGRSVLLRELPGELLDEVARDAAERKSLEDLHLHSAIVTPLVARGRVLGAMTLAADGARRPFTKSDLELAEEIAERAATAVEHARLYAVAEEARQQAEAAEHRFAFLARVGETLVGSLDQEETFEAVARLAVPAIADWCVIDVMDGPGTRRVSIMHPDPDKVATAWRVQRDYPVTLADPFGPGRVMRTGTPELYPTIPISALESLSRSPEHLEILRSFGFCSYMCVPLIARGRTHGAVTLFSDTPARRFGRDDLRLAEGLAARAGIAVDNARLYAEAREAEAARAESLAALDTLLRSAPVGMAFWDHELRFLRVNDVLAEINGRTAEEHIGRTVGELLPGLPREVSDDLREVLRSGHAITDRPVTGETPRAPGVTRHWTVSYYPVGAEEGGVRGVGAVVVEVTERRRVEQERERLYRELSHFKTTLDRTLDAVYMFDPRSLRFFYANQGAVSSVGYTRQELLAMTPVDLDPTMTESELRAVLAPLLAGTTGSTTLTRTQRRRDGSDVPVEISLQFVQPPGEEGRVIAIVRDISDRVETRARLQRLARSERALDAELKAIIRAMDAAVFVFDPRGALIFGNPAAEILFGGSAIGRFEDVRHQLDDPDGAAPVLGSRRRQGPVELPGTTSPQRWFELRAYPVFTAPEGYSGRPQPVEDVETILFVRDVTEARSSRVAHEAFVGVLSHELRTPVTTIFGNSKLLGRADRRLSPEARQEAYADIEVEAERLYRLVEDLLVLARFGEPGMELGDEPVLLQRVIPSVLRSEQQRWPLTTFQAIIPANMPAVQGDQTYVEQIIRNLLGNAAKYGQEGSRVRVVLESGEVEASVRVLDEGPGFAAEEADRLFGLFYRSPSTASKTSGAGIGLFVCKRLAEAMGGRIWARPRSSGGAEFGFALKLFAEESV